VSEFIAETRWNKHKPLDLYNGSSFGSTATASAPINRWGIRVNASIDAIREEIRR
jgi:hypothetical protein